MPQSDQESTFSALVIMGVSGSGKSACGAALATILGIAFVDGDDLHPAENVSKMRGGVPLTDEDRWPWLDRVGAVLSDRDAHPRGIVIACSALRRRYRDRIRVTAVNAVPLFLFLDIASSTARTRLGNRPGHFMPASLVDSQFDTLERPARDEGDVLTIAEAGEVGTTVETMLASLRAARP